MDVASSSPGDWDRRRPSPLAKAGSRTFFNSTGSPAPQHIDELVKERIQDRHAPTDLVTRVYRLCEPNIVGSVHAESLRRVLAHSLDFTPAETTHIVSQAVECAYAARLPLAGSLRRGGTRTDLRCGFASNCPCPAPLTRAARAAAAGGEEDSIRIKDIHAALLHHHHWDTSLTLPQGPPVPESVDRYPRPEPSSVRDLMGPSEAQLAAIESQERLRLRRRILEALETWRGRIDAWFRVTEEPEPGRALRYRTRLTYPEIHALLPRMGLRDISEEQLRVLYAHHAGCEGGMTLSQWWYHTRQPVEFAQGLPKSGDSARPAAREAAVSPHERDTSARANLQRATLRNVSLQAATLLGGRVYRDLEPPLTADAQRFEQVHRGDGRDQGQRWADKTLDRRFMRGGNVHFPERKRGSGHYANPPTVMASFLVDASTAPPPTPPFSPLMSYRAAEHVPWANDVNKARWEPEGPDLGASVRPPFDVGGHAVNKHNQRTVRERVAPKVTPPFALDVPVRQVVPASYVAGLGHTEAGELMGLTPRSAGPEEIGASVGNGRRAVAVPGS